MILFAFAVLSLVAATSGQRRYYSLHDMPVTNFDCRDKILGGYYADPEANCQMFHVCVKIPGQGVQDFRFLCPNETSFDQENQICADSGDIDCEAAGLYLENFDLYRLGSAQAKRPQLQLHSSKGTVLPLGPSTKSPILTNNINEDDEFYLQRSETGDRRLHSKDLLRGSSSSNFFNNRNKGKELDDDDDDEPSPRNQNEAVHGQRKHPVRGKSQYSSQFRQSETPVPQQQTTSSTTTTATAPVHHDKKRTKIAVRKLARKRPQSAEENVEPKTPNYSTFTTQVTHKFSFGDQDQRYSTINRAGTTPSTLPTSSIQQRYNQNFRGKTEQSSTLAFFEPSPTPSSVTPNNVQRNSFPSQNQNQNQNQNRPSTNFQPPRQTTNNQTPNYQQPKQTTPVSSTSFPANRQTQPPNFQQTRTNPPPNSANLQQTRPNPQPPIPQQNAAPVQNRVNSQNNLQQQNRPNPQNTFPQQNRPSPPNNVPQQSRPIPQSNVPQQNQPTPQNNFPQQNRPNPQNNFPQQNRPNQPNNFPPQSRTSQQNNFPQQNRPNQQNNFPQQNRPNQQNNFPQQNRPNQQNNFSQQNRLNQQNNFAPQNNFPQQNRPTTQNVPPPSNRPNTPAVNYQNNKQTTISTTASHPQTINNALQGRPTASTQNLRQYYNRNFDDFEEGDNQEFLKTAPSNNFRPSDLNSFQNNYKSEASFDKSNVTKTSTTKYYTPTIITTPKTSPTFSTSDAKQVSQSNYYTPTAASPKFFGTPSSTLQPPSSGPQPRPFSTTQNQPTASSAAPTSTKDASYDYAYYDDAGSFSEYDALDALGETDFSRTSQRTKSRLI